MTSQESIMCAQQKSLTKTTTCSCCWMINKGCMRVPIRSHPVGFFETSGGPNEVASLSMEESIGRTGAKNPLSLSRSPLNTFATIEENTIHLLLEVHNLVALAHAMYLQQEVDVRDANNCERVYLLLEVHALIVHTVTHVVHLQQEVQALTVIRVPRVHLLLEVHGVGKHDKVVYIQQEVHGVFFNG